MRALHETLLDAIAEKVGEATYLRFLLMRDEDRSITPRPELLPPAMQPSDLARDVSSHVVHEGGKLLGGLGRHQQMRVVAQDDEAVDFHSVLALRATDNADDQVIGAQPGRSRSLP